MRYEDVVLPAMELFVPGDDPRNDFDFYCLLYRGDRTLLTYKQMKLYNVIKELKEFDKSLSDIVKHRWDSIMEKREVPSDVAYPTPIEVYKLIYAHELESLMESGYNPFFITNQLSELEKDLGRYSPNQVLKYADAYAEIASAMIAHGYGDDIIKKAIITQSHHEPLWYVVNRLKHHLPVTDEEYVDQQTFPKGVSDEQIEMEVIWGQSPGQNINH